MSKNKQRGIPLADFQQQARGMGVTYLFPNSLHTGFFDGFKEVVKDPPKAAEGRRMVSCISGDKLHLFWVVPGSAADTTCRGQHISEQECPECVEERRQYLRRQSQYCECQFTPDAELCQDGCSYLKEARDTPDAPVGLEIYMHDKN